MKTLQTNRDDIAAFAATNAEENDAFVQFVRNADGKKIDDLVAAINAEVEPAIDCTECGACCKTLMINVTPAEATKTADFLGVSLNDFKEKYIEESQQGQLIMSQMPCPFLAGSRCTVYEQRFTECREFPHLHRGNFKDRMFGTMIHYAMCPIIFNVVETLKVATEFKAASSEVR